MILDFYINDKRCVISRISLIKYKDGVYWYNDLTPFKKKSLIYLMLKLRESNLTHGVESTHIDESSLINYKISLEIVTLNVKNILP